MKLSFVIPCYRSEKTIEGVVSEIVCEVGKRPGFDYEIVLVSDHSPDNVWSVIDRLCDEGRGRIKGMELARNFGQHAALMAGYAHATGDLVVSLDDDGQTPVNAVWSLVDKLEQGQYDVVYASYPDKKHNALRNLGSRVNDWMASWLLDKPVDLKVSSYFVARRFIVNEMLRYHQAFPYVIGLVLRATRNICNVPVEHREREVGGSGYTFAKLLGLWMNGFTAFSVKPLRLASLLGVVCAFVGFVACVWAILNKLILHPHAPAGYSSMMAALLFLGGIVMLILGLIGEYVGRIYICLNNSPQYVISKENVAKTVSESRERL